MKKLDKMGCVVDVVQYWERELRSKYYPKKSFAQTFQTVYMSFRRTNFKKVLRISYIHSTLFLSLKDPLQSYILVRFVDLDNKHKWYN